MARLKERIHSVELQLKKEKVQGRSGVVYFDQPLPPDTPSHPFYGFLLVPRPYPQTELGERQWLPLGERQQRQLQKAMATDIDEGWQEYFSSLAGLETA